MLPLNGNKIWMYIRVRNSLPSKIRIKDVTYDRYQGRKNNYISQCIWDVITCPRHWYLLLAQHPYMDLSQDPFAEIHTAVCARLGVILYILCIRYLVPGPHSIVFVVVSFDALAQARYFRIERRQVVFLWWMQDSNFNVDIHPSTKVMADFCSKHKN